MDRRKYFLSATAAVFAVTFTLGYVFHDLLLGDWFHRHQGALTRERYIIPLIGLAFAVYAIIQAHLFPIYRQAYLQHPAWVVGWRFGLLMGVLFDALQGGLIEVATFTLPVVVFAVDSSYHVFVEGSIAGLILGALYHKQVE